MPLPCWTFKGKPFKSPVILHFLCFYKGQAQVGRPQPPAPGKPKTIVMFSVLCFNINLKTYLENRQHYVEVSNFKTALVPTSLCVSNGSILASVLSKDTLNLYYLLYIYIIIFIFIYIDLFDRLKYKF